ncbi:uncharacterized protein BO97DRAFT_264720 [Aspergillus homomorphus CBS 101889]|uniref:Uncharacterized protein n=1 Tax=Aspergillus homomorphus (strain CBS 101889) TaxID=1450537 RepID=A0A395HHB8_ASPHC|nr:hypothetical protein BO97DRAFT_264720 [Aspergillus homomorphus CBS 101889]RAL07217.1 hypothetical protein BO97DRAFT_264720 [Aspergillus homomorphus CBS 101889]
MAFMLATVQVWVHAGKQQNPPHRLYVRIVHDKSERQGACRVIWPRENVARSRDKTPSRKANGDWYLFRLVETFIVTMKLRVTGTKCE